METGDGYLVRLRILNGAVSFDLAREIASLAERFGNGLIDLSARANLQLRGVRRDDFDALWARLHAIGLLDADSAAETVRNVTPSPLAGFDDSAALDARPIVAALEKRLTEEKALHALPSKFGFLVDGGGVLPLAGIAADVEFRALATNDGARLAIRLGGVAAGGIEPEAAPEVASALAHAFLALRGEDRRMGALVQRIGAAAVVLRAGLQTDNHAAPLPASVAQGNPLGAHALASRAFVGAAIPFGQMRAQALREMADRAKAYGAAELRLTPWRALLAPGLELAAARELAKELAAVGFILDGADPRLALAACAGKPACASAEADVRATALALAPFLADYRGTLHISGCAKGCAFNAPAPLTFVATPRGYDLIENGFARNEPARRDLNFEALAACLRALGKGAAA
jgi:precorrin-3B synthase